MKNLLEDLRRTINSYALRHGLDLRQATFRVARSIGAPWNVLNENELRVAIDWVNRDAPGGDVAMRRTRRAIKRRILSHILQIRPQKKKTRRKKKKSLSGRDPKAARKAILVPGRGHYRRSALK